MDENRITYFAETDARGRKVKFGIKAKDRTRHVYVLGKTGMGKSTLLENMAAQDIQGGEGMCFIDPHGKTADLLLEYVPKERIRDVIYIVPFDTDYPISFNVLESVDPDKRHLVVSGLMSTFKKIWVDAWSARMEYILTNTLLALLEAPGSTLLGVNRMLSDKIYRNEIISHVKDPSVKTFWVKEFAGYTERMAAEAVPAIQNKVGQFTANPLIRNMIGQPVSSFDFREAMDKRKIMIINLSKGKIGDENMKLLGGLLVTKIYLAAMSRADVPDRVMKMLPNFYLYVDEFQNFANASFADILSEARKYHLNLTIAHQYVEQMDEIVRPAVFGNVGTMIIFRVGATDAEMLEKEFAPQFTIEDLVNLGFTQIYLKLMIDGLTSSPFSATTMPPIVHPDSSYVNDIIAASREQFAKERAGVEAEIVKFHETVVKTSAPLLKPAALAPKPATTVPAAVVSAAAVVAAVAPAAKIPLSPAPRPTPPKPHEPSVKIEASSKPPIQSPAPQLQNPVSSLVKPVSLAVLAPKPQSQPRVDARTQSPQNVNELKNALAAALGKKKETASMEQEVASNKMPIQSATTKPIEPATPPISELKPVPKLAGQPAIASTKNPALLTVIAPTSLPMTSSQSSVSVPEPPKEVPEEILKKVLKVE